MYYLQSRYYSPALGRFISPDSIDYLEPQVIDGLNLYAYCLNNPIMYVGPSGHMPEWAKWLLLGVATGLSIAAMGVGMMISAPLIGGVLIGAGSGFLMGAGTSIVSQGVKSNWQDINPMYALKSGGIGAAIGAITGLSSIYFGQIGSQIGSAFGCNLSQAVAGGMQIGKILSFLGGSNTLINIFNFAGNTVGAFVGGMLANELANNMFDKNPTIEENVQESINGIFQDWLLELIKKYLRWLV